MEHHPAGLCEFNEFQAIAEVGQELFIVRVMQVDESFVIPMILARAKTPWI